jgi:hypothetical protein
MRKLFFTTGSPFARAVRIVLVEKGLEFEREETFTTPSVEERAKVAPTLQVPTLVDGNLTLWDSAVIIDYSCPAIQARPRRKAWIPWQPTMCARRKAGTISSFSLRYRRSACRRRRCRNCNGLGSDMKKMATPRDAPRATSIFSIGSRLSLPALTAFSFPASFRLRTSCSPASVSSLKRAHCDCPGVLLADPSSRRWSPG